MQKIYTKIDQVSGNVIALAADDVAYGELAIVSTAQGDALAEVIRIEGDLVFLQVYSGGAGISTRDEVRFLGYGMQVSFSENLLGRIFNGAGQPLDNGPQLTDCMIEINTPSVNPACRIIPSKMIRTGIPISCGNSIPTCRFTLEL